VIILLVMGAGYWSYTRLPVDAFPDVSPNLVQVFTVTEGLAPEEVEKYVTYPVESAMTGLPGITEIRSISNFGLSVVSICFEDGMDIYFTRQLVNERLQKAREQIPEGFGEPEMGPIATAMGLILYYNLEDTTGTYSLTELRTMQDWIIKYQLQTVPGVTEVLGIGGYEKQYQVTSILRRCCATTSIFRASSSASAPTTSTWAPNSSSGTVNSSLCVPKGWPMGSKTWPTSLSRPRMAVPSTLTTLPRLRSAAPSGGGFRPRTAGKRSSPAW